MLQSIKRGDRGEAVADWQFFLLGQGFYNFEVDAKFDEKTHRATKAFQRHCGLTGGDVDGWVGRTTYGFALTLGYDPAAFTFQDSTDQPSPPDFRPLNVARKHQLFGRIQYEAAGTSRNKEAIRITNGWSKNVTRVPIPQLVGLPGAARLKTFFFHKKVADQVQGLFQAWEDAGLAHLVLGFGGSWVPRFVRGSRSTLSSHAWATAFDINVPWNMRGTFPARVGAKGSVRELVPIAYEHGFYWGGHFSKRDGMHFEVVEIL
jgi:peptidoglycan hydrolase-like protein with peptidoglycan-binding domain